MAAETVLIQSEIGSIEELREAVGSLVEKGWAINKDVALARLIRNLKRDTGIDLGEGFDFSLPGSSRIVALKLGRIRDTSIIGVLNNWLTNNAGGAVEEPGKEFESRALSASEIELLLENYEAGLRAGNDPERAVREIVQRGQIKASEGEIRTLIDRARLVRDEVVAKLEGTVEPGKAEVIAVETAKAELLAEERVNQLAEAGRIPKEKAEIMAREAGEAIVDRVILELSSEKTTERKEFKPVVGDGKKTVVDEMIEEIVTEGQAAVVVKAEARAEARDIAAEALERLKRENIGPTVAGREEAIRRVLETGAYTAIAANPVMASIGEKMTEAISNRELPREAKMGQNREKQDTAQEKIERMIKVAGPMATRVAVSPEAQEMITKAVDYVMEEGGKDTAVERKLAVAQIIGQLEKAGAATGTKEADRAGLAVVLRRKLDEEIESRQMELVDSGKAETAIREGALEVEAGAERFIRNNWPEVMHLRGITITESLEESFGRQETPEAIKAVRDYATQVAKLTEGVTAFDSLGLPSYQQFLDRGGSEQDYTRLKVLVGMMGMDKEQFGRWVETYMASRMALTEQGVEIPYRENNQVLATEELMNLWRNDNEFKELLGRAQGLVSLGNYGGIWGKIAGTVDGWTGGRFSGFLGQVSGLRSQAFDYLGKQVTNEFMRSSLAVLGKEGLQQGLKTILKGVLAGGVKAGAGAAASVAGGTAAGVAGGAAAGAAAGTAVMPVVGTILGAIAGFLGQKVIGRLMSFFGLGKLKDALAKVPGGLLGAGVAAASAVIMLPTLLVGAAVAPAFIFPALMGKMFVDSISRAKQVSMFVPPKGAGEVGDETASTEGGGGGGGRAAGGKVTDAKCSSADLGGKVNWVIKQNSGPWADDNLPKGCNFAQAACGPTSVSKALINKYPTLNPREVVYEPGSPYLSMGCDGSSINQAAKFLQKYLGSDAVTYNGLSRGCDKKAIANALCDGGIVLMLGNFYFNDNGASGGHFALAVKFNDGEVYLSDPYYNDGGGSEPQMDGQVKRGHVQSIRACLVVDGDKL